MDREENSIEPLATNKHQDIFEHPERLPDIHDRGERFVRAESSMHRPNGRLKRPAPQNVPVSFLRAIVHRRSLLATITSRGMNTSGYCPLRCWKDR